jgi:hypothetical protein
MSEFAFKNDYFNFIKFQRKMKYKEWRKSMCAELLRVYVLCFNIIEYPKHISIIYYRPVSEKSIVCYNTV